MGSGGVKATTDIERQIDENLRLIYRQCLDEEMSPRLQALLDQMEDEGDLQ